MAIDPQDIEWLTRYIDTRMDTRFEGSDRVHATERESDRRAIELAREDIGRRLHDMNQFRDDIKEDRVVFVTRVEVEAKLAAAERETRGIEERVRALENRQAWLMGGLALLVLVSNLIGRFLH